LAETVLLLLYSTRTVRTGMERALVANLRNVFKFTRRNTLLNALASLSKQPLSDKAVTAFLSRRTRWFEP
jgi:hypothetical protein